MASVDVQLPKDVTSEGGEIFLKEDLEFEKKEEVNVHDESATKPSIECKEEGDKEGKNDETLEASDTTIDAVNEVANKSSIESEEEVSCEDEEKYDEKDIIASPSEEEEASIKLEEATKKEEEEEASTHEEHVCLATTIEAEGSEATSKSVAEEDGKPFTSK